MKNLKKNCKKESILNEKNYEEDKEMRKNLIEKLEGDVKNYFGWKEEAKKQGYVYSHDALARGYYAKKVNGEFREAYAEKYAGRYGEGYKLHICGRAIAHGNYNSAYNVVEYWIKED